MLDKLHIVSLLFLLALSGSAIAQADTLIIGIHREPPFIIGEEDGGYSGLSVDLWSEIAEALELNYTYREFSDEIGIIRAIDYGEIDLSINPLVNNPQRMGKFDVSQPYYISNLGIAISTSGQSQLQIFVENFFSQAFLKVILLLLLILLFFGTLLWAVERRHNKYQFRPGAKGLLDGLWWAAVTMTTVGYGDKAPKTNAGRSIAIIWMFTAVIIISSFTATIASTLTINTLAANIKGLSDLRLVEKIGVVGATQSVDFLKEKGLEPYEVYRSASQAMRALAREDIRVLVHDKLELEYLINTNRLGDRVQLLNVGFEPRYRSFMMPRNHPLGRAINLELITQLQAATWRSLMEKYTLKGN